MTENMDSMICSVSCCLYNKMQYKDSDKGVQTRLQSSTRQTRDINAHPMISLTTREKEEMKYCTMEQMRQHGRALKGANSTLQPDMGIKAGVSPHSHAGGGSREEDTGPGDRGNGLCHHVT